jgi:hypothetical protein
MLYGAVVSVPIRVVPAQKSTRATPLVSDTVAWSVKRACAFKVLPSDGDVNVTVFWTAAAAKFAESWSADSVGTCGLLAAW